MRIAINPSTQFHNQYVCSGDVEGHVMGAYGRQIVDLLNHYGAPEIEAKLFWDSGPYDSYREQTDAAAAWGAELFFSFHTDSAGDQNNDGRGYTGSLLCYRDPEGKRIGQAIQGRLLHDMGWPDAGAKYRTDLYVLNRLAPSLLLEIGNHSDPDDCRALLDYPEKFCQSIVWGIFEYLGINPKNAKEAEIVLGRLHQTGPHTWKILEVGETGSAYNLHVGIRDDAPENTTWPVRVWVEIMKNGKYENYGDTLLIKNKNDIGRKDIPASYTGPIKVSVDKANPPDILDVDGRY